MDDWLQLTEEDIARAHRLTRAQPPMPDVVIITPADMTPPSTPSTVPGGDETPALRAAPTAPTLRITLDDLTPAPPQAQPDPELRRLEQVMFALLNQARQMHLPGWLSTGQLTWQDELANIARGHSQDMLQRQYVAHVTPEGVTAAQRLDQGHIRYLACGENIGIVYGEASHGEQGLHEIHDAFMNQPRSLSNHRGNLLNPIWTHVGIGIAYSRDGTLVVTQNFISAPAARLRGR
ncbi:MAG: CAP domain-containing protein [Anaerolineales bacterium]|nr:CAP domain-containing protein [Anaerolineales bacterium]MCB8952190.1 CAP domain-containing protein [Ardenticatenales bacterium]